MTVPFLLSDDVGADLAATAPAVAALRTRAASVRLMVFDVDGVFTDASLYYGHDGEVMKSFSTLDGHGIKQLAKLGITTAIITGRTSGIVSKRATELGIAHVYQGAGDKWSIMTRLLAETGHGVDSLGYMGDDWPDLCVLSRARLACAPANAHADLRSRVHLQTAARGGSGAVRQVCDVLMHAHLGTAGYAALLREACGD